MRRTHQPLALLLFLLFASAAAAATACDTRPPFLLLAGDSTTASDGGWGDGLLATLGPAPAAGANHGRSGATTASYVAEGLWAAVMTGLRERVPGADVYVTISFGHNDQKPENNVSFAQYRENLDRMAREVLHLGGTPILTSSLTRRVFTSPHNATDSLGAERAATAAVAQRLGAAGAVFVDLNAASRRYVNAVGAAAAQAYDWGPGDRTHLNPRGTVVFGRMMADLLVRARPCWRPWVERNETLSRLIWTGLPA